MSGWDSDYRYEPAPLYEHVFRCGLPRDEGGNRILMPLSSLHVIETLPVRFPLFFKIEGFNSDKISYCGVLDFTADEGFVHLPTCMMENLGLEVGDDVVLCDASLTRGSYMKLRPHETAFVELPDPRAVLEQALRSYACLSRGDTFVVRFDGRDYYLDVMELSPGEAVSLIETDCVLEFAPALDYVEPPPPRDGGGRVKKVKPLAAEDEAKKDCGKEEFVAFSGESRVLGGGFLGMAAASSEWGTGEPSSEEEEEEEEEEESDESSSEEEEKGGFKAFTGKGRVLGGRFLGRAVASNGRAVMPAGFSYKAAPVEGKKVEKDGGGAELKACGERGDRVTGGPSSEAAAEEAKKGGEGEKREFKAFSGKGRVLGGSSLDAEREEDGWSVAGRGPARAAAVVEQEKKSKKEEAKEEFKAFSGKGRVLGGPNLF